MGRVGDEVVIDLPRAKRDDTPKNLKKAQRIYRGRVQERPIFSEALVAARLETGEG